ncbi:MAG TPA: hypothetical protein PK762_13300 [Candidatus Kapabacteria bacterium]|nr:hypothetical protein [Candidatus Kapabacteria bacterium]
MLKRIIFLFVVCFFASGFASPKINQYIQKEKPGKDDIVVIAFQYPVGCIKCVLQIEDIIKVLNHKLPNKVKVIALVLCDREIELKAFIKNNNWKYTAYKVKFKELKDYGATEKTMMKIYNSKSELLLDLFYDDNETNAKLKAFIELY